MMRFVLALALALSMAACDQPSSPSAAISIVEGAEPRTEPIDTPGFDPVDMALQDAPTDIFRETSPADLGIVPSREIKDALAALLAPRGEGVQKTPRLSVRVGDLAANADVVQEDLLDDSVADRHVRVAFHYSPGDEQWVATGVWERFKCRRGPNAGEWTKELCP